VLLGIAALALALGARPVVVFRDFSCPPGYRAQAISVTEAVSCEPTDAVPPGAATLPPERRYGSSQRELGLYFANVRMRVFDFDLIAGSYLWVGWNVPAP
jgi:hypothetical protein